MNGKLYVVATPIGNREDITIRAKRILAEVDAIAAEDTRVTQNLLRLLDIKCKLISNHKHNEHKQVPHLLQELMNGKKIALVSDAGTPCIADPGGVLVEAALIAGIPVEGICGANAVVMALSISGFRFNSFVFGGFLPKSSKEIQERFESLSHSEFPVAAFFESPKRVKRTIRILAETLPDALVCLCNDLTKRYERIYRGSPAVVLGELNNNEFAEKGEYTLIVAHATKHPNTPRPSMPDKELSIEALLVDYMIKNRCSLKQAISGLSLARNQKRKALYSASLQLKSLFANDLEKGKEDVE